MNNADRVLFGAAVAAESDLEVFKKEIQPVLDEYRAKLAETQIEQVGARLRALNVREEAAEVHGVG